LHRLGVVYREGVNDCRRASVFLTRSDFVYHYSVCSPRAPGEEQQEGHEEAGELGNSLVLFVGIHRTELESM
jgi:hypothetical protein